MKEFDEEHVNPTPPAVHRRWSRPSTTTPDMSEEERLEAQQLAALEEGFYHGSPSTTAAETLEKSNAVFASWEAEKTLQDVIDKEGPAARYNEGKAQLSYLLDFPKAMDAFALVCMEGAKKYARDNWKRGGKPSAEYLDSALRHMRDMWGWQQVFDGDLMVTYHAAHIMWNMAAYIELNIIDDKDIGRC